MAKVFLNRFFSEDPKVMSLIEGAGYDMAVDSTYSDENFVCFDVKGPDIPETSPYTVVFWVDTDGNRIWTERVGPLVDEDFVIPFLGPSQISEAINR